MSRIFDYISRERAQELLDGYSKGFGSSVFLLDTDKKPLLKSPPKARGSTLAVRPIDMRDTHLGYVAMHESGPNAPRLDFIADNMMRLVDAGYEIESLAGEVARNYEEISLMWRLSGRLGAGLDVDRVCAVLSDEVMNLVPSTNVSVLLVVEIPMADISHDVCYVRNGEVKEPSKKLFIPKVSVGRDSSTASTMTMSAGAGLMGQVYDRKEAITVCDVSRDRRFEGLPFPVTRILIIPMVVEDSVMGAVVATDKLNGEEFYSTEIKLLSSIASECAVSIKKALLFDEIRDMLFRTAEAFSFAIDAKDPYTYGHSKRVTEIAVGIAKEMDIPDETISWIKLAALLHDTGKIGVPEEILNKSGRLDDEAMSKMREHPEIGARMIGHIHRFGKIANWICHHHEHFDGTGYPKGLKAGEIPLASRIITVADTFDALTSDRSYRKALKKGEAMSVMRSSVGAHLDPEVFECFERVSDRF